MSKTAIQWTDSTWNPTTGCTKVSAGCDHCYAQTLHNQRYRANVKAALAFPTNAEPIIEAIAFHREVAPKRLPFPATYDTPFVLRKRSLAGRRVFVNSMSDLFHEQVPTEFIDQVFAVMALRPDVTFQVLTKRPERMREYVANPRRRFDVSMTAMDIVFAEVTARPGARAGRGVLFADDENGEVTLKEWPLPNVWLGVSVEDQRAANERIPLLLETPAAVRFLSCEPLLASVDLERWLHDSDCWMRHQRFGGDLKDFCECNEPREDIHWVIAGGESGKGARPADLAWFRSIRDQCAAAGVPFFMKQLGARPSIGYVETAAGSDVFEADVVRLRNRHGGDWDEWPADLRVREFPS